MNRLLDLFLTFARIGGLTFGGGYAMLPILQREVVEKKKWTPEEELMDYYAIGQCTPGVIAVIQRLSSVRDSQVRSAVLLQPWELYSRP